MKKFIILLAICSLMASVTKGQYFETSSFWYWSDSSSYGPDSVLFCDSSNHADLADSSLKIDTTYAPFQTYVTNHGGGLSDQSVKGDHVDSTAEDFVFDDAYKVTSAESDSLLSTEYYVQVIVEDSLDEYALIASPTFTTDIETPLVIGGTATTSDLSFKTTSDAGEAGADMHFLVGSNGATEAMTILNNGYVGIGTNAPNAPLEVKGVLPGEVGGFYSGIFHVTNVANAQYTGSVITGHSAYSTNTQLWWLGSTSSGNDDIGLINRQDGDLHFYTNDASRMVIDATGYIGIGTLSPPERLSVVGNIATGDTATGDVDVFHYFSTNGSWTTEYVKWDDGVARFEFSDDIYTASSIMGDSVDVQHLVSDVQVSTDSVATIHLTINGKEEFGDKHWKFTIGDPDNWYTNIDHEFCIDNRTSAALTVTRIDVSCDADPTTEFEYSLKFADAFIGFANAVVIDDTATVAGITTVTGGFGDATIPANKAVYLLFDADPDDNIKQINFNITWDYD